MTFRRQKTFPFSSCEVIILIFDHLKHYLGFTIMDYAPWTKLRIQCMWGSFCQDDNLKHHGSDIQSCFKHVILISQRLCSREEKLSFIIVFVYFFKSPMNHQIWTLYHHFLQMSHTNRAAIQRDNDALMLWSIDVEFVTGSIQMPFKISIFLISP